jgi:methionine sulfoxide reductase catalytic subunit
MSLKDHAMINFDAAHKAVHYPADRKFRIWIRPSILIAVCVVILMVIAAAWLQFAFAGLPYIPPLPQVYPNAVAEPHGFPVWVRYCHFFNFLFVMMLIRSGLSILMDHPRLYFNNDCTPGSEWIHFTPVKVPLDRILNIRPKEPGLLSVLAGLFAAIGQIFARNPGPEAPRPEPKALLTQSSIWTAKDDSRYISPLIGTPGYRHTVGVARAWHFIDVHGFIITGIVFIIMLFDTEQWRRLVPTSWLLVPQAWAIFVHYVTFHMPPEPNGFYAYNALQQFAYFGVIFVLGPLAILTGIAMSPAVVNHFPWYARIFGGRQSARSIHFLTMLSFSAFIVVHVALVVISGFARNMNHIVFGTDNQSHSGLILGWVGIAIVVLSWIAAHYISWSNPRLLQHAEKFVTYPMQLLTLNRLVPQGRYTEQDISPYFWPNGKMPLRSDWINLAENGFRDYRLKVGGLVEKPVELSLADIEAMGRTEYITMHHCIQGWSGIAKWGGISMKTLIDLVRPLRTARVVAFYSFGGTLYSGDYYDTQSLENVLQAECLLATHMNGEPLSVVYGAPLRLRVENQLGYKMVKWIERIEFVESEKQLGKGEGGSNEDGEYFDLLPNI